MILMPIGIIVVSISLYFFLIHLLLPQVLQTLNFSAADLLLQRERDRIWNQQVVLLAAGFAAYQIVAATHDQGHVQQLVGDSAVEISGLLHEVVQLLSAVKLLDQLAQQLLEEFVDG